MNSMKKFLLLIAFCFAASIIYAADAAPQENPKDKPAPAVTAASAEEDDDDEEEAEDSKEEKKVAPAKKDAEEDDEEEAEDSKEEKKAEPAKSETVKQAVPKVEEKAAPAEVKAAPVEAAKAAPAAEVKAIPAEAAAVSAKDSSAIVEAAVQEDIEESQNSIGKAILSAIVLYIPNRIMDLIDCFTFEVGLGANVRFNILMTRIFAFGGGIGPYEMFGFGYHRQAGAYLQKGWSVDFFGLSKENTIRYDTWGTMTPFWVERDSLPSLSDPVSVKRQRDYFAYGVELGAFANLSVLFHPTSFGDFLLGLIFVDLQHDDWKLNYSDDPF